MTADPRRPSQLYRPDIDGLRAVAILSVVGYHVGLPGFSGGFVGVDVFFVISGYLITGLLFEEAIRTGKIGFWEFYARRVRRLVPALFVVLIATLLLGTFLLLPLGQQQGLARSAIATALFAANFHFWNSGGAYFDSPADLKTLLNMWTLAVEEQFYIVWPFLIFVLVLLSRKMNGLARLCVGAFLSVFVVSLALSLCKAGCQHLRERSANACGKPSEPGSEKRAAFAPLQDLGAVGAASRGPRGCHL